MYTWFKCVHSKFAYSTLHMSVIGHYSSFRCSYTLRFSWLFIGMQPLYNAVTYLQEFMVCLIIFNEHLTDFIHVSAYKSNCAVAQLTLFAELILLHMRWRAAASFC